MKRRKVDEEKVYASIHSCRFVHQRLRIYAKAYGLIHTRGMVIVKKPGSTAELLIYKAEGQYSEKAHATYLKLLEEELF